MSVTQVAVDYLLLEQTVISIFLVGVGDWQICLKLRYAEQL